VSTTLSRDPIATLTDALQGDFAGTAGTFALALALHGAAAALVLTRLLAPPAADVDRITQMIDIDLPAPRAPPPSTSVPSPPARRSDAAKPAARAPTAAAPRPSPAAAILTKKEEPDEPVDLTGSFISGSAASFAGGATGAGPVGPSVAVGAHESTAAPKPRTPPAQVGPDRSKPARQAGGSMWRCPFPPEADSAQVDRAVVRLRVDVEASGRPKQAYVLSDPGFGFGREAARCAMTSPWTAALDRAGSPVDAIAVVDVRFER
jgi:protein TonB